MLGRLNNKIFRDDDLNINEDLNRVIYGNETIFGLVRKYGKENKQKEIRYKIMGIKRRISDINLIRNELLEIILH